MIQNIFSIQIEKLIAWGSGVTVDAPPHDSFLFLSEESYFLKEINPAQARRLSLLTKVSVDLALRVSKEIEVDHIVFSSRHGEIESSTKLLSMIGDKDVLSPMLFSQSVHNTSIGTFTLLKKLRSAATSLGNGRSSFMAGMVSAYLYLKENPTKKVLYISGDERIPDVFSDSLAEKNVPYAMAMILSLPFEDAQDNSIKIEFKMNPNKKEKPQKNLDPQGIEFLKWFFSNLESVEFIDDSFRWILDKSK